MNHTETKYSCDLCGKRLRTHSNNVVIVTPTMPESASPSWSRMLVTVEHHHGMHNDGTKEPADLCQKCAAKLLKDALRRVEKGERLTAGVEHSEMSRFGAQ